MQGHFHVAGVFAGEDSTHLTGPAIATELKELLRLLVICMHFSKKPYPLFLEITGFTSDHVLIQEGKAGVIFLILDKYGKRILKSFPLRVFAQGSVCRKRLINCCSFVDT